MITVAEPLSAGLIMIDGFLLSVEIATNCDSDKLPILSRCLLMRSPFYSFGGVSLPSMSRSLNGQANVSAICLPFPASNGCCPIRLS